METMTGYFRTLEQSLDCPKAVYRPFLVRTRQMAEDFFQSRPGATPEEAADYLGDPRELANGFLETLDPDVVERHRSRKKALLRSCVAVLAVALIGVTAWALHIWNEPMHIEITERTSVIEEFTLP